MNLKIVAAEQAASGQQVSVDELAQYLSQQTSLAQFHQTLPDEIQSVLAPYLGEGQNTYLNKLKSLVNSERWRVISSSTQSTPIAYKSAYYPHFQQDTLPPRATSPISESSAPELQYQYCVEICGDKATFSQRVGWAPVLASTSAEPALKKWLVTDTEWGQCLTAIAKTNVSRQLFFEARNTVMPLAVSDITLQERNTLVMDEAFMAVMPAVQFGDRLCLPTQGYYYHFVDGQLIQEYQILGNQKSGFCPTYSDATALSDDLRSPTPQSAIALFWRKAGVEVANQYLVYRLAKLTSEELAEVSADWLEHHGLAMNIADLLNAGAGIEQDNPRYHAPMSATYQHSGRLLHGTQMVALNNASAMSKGIPVVNLKPEKIFRIGVFFDGTGQNDKNDAYKEQRGNKSRTNVARLFAAYPQNKGESTKLYVSGVGTLDIEDDSQRPALIDAHQDETALEQAFGVDINHIPGLEAWLIATFGAAGYLGGLYAQGKTGAFYKWQSVLTQLKAQITDLIQSGDYEKITHLAFDVIGFSRGAALARHFVNAVYQGLPDYSLPLLEKVNDVAVFPNLRGDERAVQDSAGKGYHRDNSRGVSVRFVGLFDTVGSFYLAGNRDEGNFNLALEPTSAHTVLQIIAHDEYRKNFPLTSLARKGWLAENFHQEVFPGCHSDVGGGYPSDKQYAKQGLPEDLGMPVGSSYNRELVKSHLSTVNPAAFYYPGGSADRARFEQREWQQAQEQWGQTCLAQHQQYGEVKVKDRTLYYYRLQPISNALAGLALERMKQQGQACGIEWIERAYQENLTPDYQSDDLCQSIWQTLQARPLGGISTADWEVELNSHPQRYVHRSHDTIINPGYDTLGETLINSITTDGAGQPQRRVWDNE